MAKTKLPAAASTGLRPILFLDVDDTLVSYARARTSRPLAATGAATFLQWAVRHFDVRWLTAWFSGGGVDEQGAQELAELLGCAPALIGKLPAVKWSTNKAAALDWEELAGREWVWVEDELLDEEHALLRTKQVQGRYLWCNVSTSDGRLQEVVELLAARYGVPSVDLSTPVSGDDDLRAEAELRCPKCGETSGNDWTQCGGVCPMPMSPHFMPLREEAE